MRLRARTDGNQREIVDALRKAGCSVAVTSQLGKGFPDLVVGYEGKNYLFEVKDPSRGKAGLELTIDEAKFHLDWRGQVTKICSASEALEAINGTCAKNQKAR